MVVCRKQDCGVEAPQSMISIPFLVHYCNYYFITFLHTLTRTSIDFPFQTSDSMLLGLCFQFPVISLLAQIINHLHSLFLNNFSLFFYLCRRAEADTLFAILR